MTHETLKPCDYCDATGIVEVMKDCGKPASECCGGCVKNAECPICDGSGEIIVETH